MSTGMTAMRLLRYLPPDDRQSQPRSPTASPPPAAGRLDAEPVALAQCELPHAARKRLNFARRTANLTVANATRAATAQPVPRPARAPRVPHGRAVPRRRGARVDDGPGRRQHVEVAEAPAVERHRLLRQAGETVVNGRAGDGVGAVNTAGDLRVGVAQVEPGALAVDAEAQADGDRSA